MYMVDNNTFIVFEPVDVEISRRDYNTARNDWDEN
jgi:hypothetical protein